MAYFNFKDVSFSYDDKRILENFSFSLEKGEILLIKGPSGIGKSTILKIISGLVEINKGVLVLDNIDITNLAPEKRNVGFLFQNFSLFPHLTVEKNILYGLKSKSLDYWLNLINMSAFKKVYPNSLSGGQQQRVALVRSLANNPKLLLLDEPFSSLDDKLKTTLRNEIYRILKDHNITTIIVSHDISDSAICDRVLEI